MARVVAGAIVSDSGNWYYTGFRWKPLVTAPPDAAPPFAGAERGQLLQLMKQVKSSDLSKAGERLAVMITELGSLEAAEQQLQITQPPMPSRPAAAPRTEQSSEASMPSPQVKVKTYKNAKAYERDAARMSRDGWVPQGQSGSRGKVNMGRTVGKALVFLPWALMRPSRKGEPITVTWVRS